MKQDLLHLVALAASVSTCLSVTGCGTAESPAHATVFAAASLGSVGGDLAVAFESEHPGSGITFNFAGSSALLRQIGEGAPADIFIPADVPTMDRARELPEFVDADPAIIASNTLVLATSSENPAGITSLADVRTSRIAICAPEVPCGALAHRVLERSGVSPGMSTEEANVTDVATRISTGAVDAGFVYSTDARALSDSGEITVIELPGAEPTLYPLALTTSGRSNEVAGAFTAFLGSERARDILDDHGFGRG
ncbi:molybdate ABC transporter substrate-binding protein [Corynebacterium pacaense]|uniref:molybdate ABC transporter substrate-binding protein n=1 Tax=Corynebacterium pacaense TaxID=1816684 RepID=UPI0009BB1763|nr:molybdate ABC transporter substrate-binding protein [Corynebacterium pacaense]